MLFALLQLNACNTKSPTIQIITKDGADAAPEEIYNEVSGEGTKTEGTKTVPPKTDPVEAGDGDESASVPTPITGAPVADNTKGNGEQVIPNGRYFIKAGGSKKCISLPNDSRELGVQFVQRTCDTSNNNMKFQISIAESGYFLIFNVGTGLAMEIRDQMPVMQAALQQNNRVIKAYQDFVIQERGDGRYHIKTRLGGMFVDLAGASISDGALVQLWNQGDTMSSGWILEPAP